MTNIFHLHGCHAMLVASSRLQSDFNDDILAAYAAENQEKGFNMYALQKQYYARQFQRDIIFPRF